MKNLLLLILSFILSPAIFSQSCNLLNNNGSSTAGLNTSGISTNGGSTIACTIANSVLYSSSTNAYIATGDLSVSQGNAVTLNFQAKRASCYSGTCEIWVHVGGYCSFTVYTTPYNTNGWVQIGTFNPNTTCSGFGPFTVPSDVIGGQNISYCIVLKNASSSSWVSIDDICVSEISGSAVPTTYNETFGNSSSGWYPNSGYIGVPYHTYKNASDAYVILGAGEGGGTDKAAYFYTGFDFCSTVSGTGIVTKEINTSGYANGEIRLSFKSQYPCSGPPSYTFDEDYTNYSPEVYIMTGPDFGGNTWTLLPVNYYFADYTWRVASYDISAYKNANVRIKVERGGFCSSAMEAVDNMKIIDRDCSISLLACGTITGETAPLQNTSYAYSVPAVTGATYYKWYVRYGGTLYDAAPYIEAGQGTQNVTINFNSLPTTDVRVLCIPFDVDPSIDQDACYAQIGYLNVSVSNSTPLTLDSVDSTLVTCNGMDDGTITLNVSGGQPAYTYTWVPNVSSTNTATGLAPGTYQITVTDQNADQLFVDVIITEPNPVTVNPIANQTICEGANFADILFTGSAGATFNWTNDNTIIGLSSSGTGDILSFTGAAAGVANVLVTPSSGACTGASESFVLTVNPLDDASFNYPSGTSFCLTGTDPIASITGTTSGTFSYLLLSGGPNLDINSSSGNITLANSDPGDYSVIYTTGGICAQQSILTITISAPPVADFNYGIYCANETDPLPTFISGGTAGTFSSTSGLIINPTTGEVDLDSSTAGTYIVTNTITSAGCGTVFFNNTITINEIPDATINGDATVCQGTALPDIVFTITAGLPDWTITYNLDGTPVNANGISSSPYIISGAAGTYDLVSITDANGCTNSLTGQVVQTINPTPVMNPMGDTSVWAGDNVVLPGFSTVSVPSTFTWTNTTGTDIGFGLSGIGNINPFTAINGTTSDIVATVEVTPTSIDGCLGAPISFNIRVFPQPVNSTTNYNPDDIIIFPNPVDDYLTITNLPINSRIELVDMNGKKIRIDRGESTPFSYNSEQLAKGTYTLVIRLDDKIFYRKFVKN